MSAILDILIVVIIGVTIGFAVKNGFVKTVLSAASFLIALVVAFLFVAPVRDAFLESGMAVKVRTAVDESITSFVTDTSEEQEELPEFLTKLEFIGIDKDELQTKWNNWRSGNTEALKNELAAYDYIGVKLAMGVATREEYAEEIAHTETLRQRIRALESEVG